MNSKRGKGRRSYHNIETNPFPGVSHRVAYGDGVWRVHNKGVNRWLACHRRNKHPCFIARTLGDISKRLEEIAKQAEGKQ